MKCAGCGGALPIDDFRSHTCPVPPEPDDSPVGVAATAECVTCRGCGQPLAFDFAAQRIADGCPCNSRRGINHGLVPTHVCTCDECDPAQTGAVRPGPEPAPYGHVSRADECQDETRCELDETVTRAELEELRRRVERLESGRIPRG